MRIARYFHHCSSHQFFHNIISIVFCLYPFLSFLHSNSKSLIFEDFLFFRQYIICRLFCYLSFFSSISPSLKCQTALNCVIKVISRVPTDSSSLFFVRALPFFFFSLPCTRTCLNRRDYKKPFDFITRINSYTRSLSSFKDWSVPRWFCRCAHCQCKSGAYSCTRRIEFIATGLRDDARIVLDINGKNHSIFFFFFFFSIKCLSRIFT